MEGRDPSGERQVSEGGRMSQMIYRLHLELADLVAHAAREKYHGAYANHGVN